MLKILGRLAARLKLGASPKDAITNLGGYLFPAAGVIESLIQTKLISDKYQPLVIVLPSIGALLIGQPGGKDQNLNSPVKIE
jgi:hypothetical protein